MSDLMSVPEARAIVKNTIKKNRSTLLPINKCGDHVLTETVLAREPFPAFRTSAMDGYGFCYDDLNTNSPLIQKDVISAGDNPDIQLSVGECVKIMTGAPVPSDVDTVVPVENTEKTEAGVKIQHPKKIEAGANIRSAGEEIEEQDIVMKEGAYIRPYELSGALLAGRSRLSVVKAPSAAVLITGDELVADPNKSLKPGQIRDTNQMALKHLLEMDGATLKTVQTVPDEPEATKQQFQKAVRDHDVVISTGGISVGDRDHVKDTLNGIGANVLFHGVALKPGKPVAFAEIEGTYVFALPGNVVSALVNYELFVRPGLFKIRGLGFRGRPHFNAISKQDWPEDPNRHVFYRVTTDDRSYPKTPQVHKSRNQQGSHMITTLTEADGLLKIPPGKTIKEGDPVRIMELRMGR